MSDTPNEASSDPMDPSSDPLIARLAALAPAADLHASRELFERHRRRPVTSRHWLLPAAAITLLVAGIVGVWAVARTGSSPTVPVVPTENPSGEPTGDDDVTPTDFTIGNNVELLAVSQTMQPGGTIRIATTMEERDRVLDGLHAEQVDVTVDLTRSIMVALTIDGNSCPLTLEGFDVADSVWSPRLAESDQSCDDIGVTWAYVVAISRDELGSGITIRLPAHLGGGEATAELEIDLPGTDVPVTRAATGDEFVMLAVEEAQLEFGSILVAYDAEGFDQMWARSFGDAEQPTVNFDHLVAVAFTLPDDACPDILTQFAVEPPTGEGPTVWEPQFEPPPGGCRLPLITRTYVVGVDRQALGSLVTFRLPGDDVYDFESNTVTVKLGRRESSGSPAASPTLTPTGVRVLLPPVGEPRLAVGTFGIVWVVQHADGTAAVLDAVVERRPDEDDGGVTGLGDLVAPTTTGDGFGNGSFVWDSHGRAVNGPRTSDLTGFAGKVVDGEVELLLSDATTVPGSSEPVTGEFRPPRLENLPLLDLGTLPTLSFSGPIWRYLDATLVVENGVGTLCSVDPTASVDALATCDDGYPTAVRSTQPEITSWHFGPLLAEFDEFGRIVRIAPLGGRASRNDGTPATGPTDGPVTIVGVTPRCDPVDDPAIVEVRLLPAVPGDEVNVTVQIVDDTGVRGETAAFTTSSDAVTIEVPIESLDPPAVGRAVVLSLGDPPVVLDEAPMTGCS